MAHIKYILVPVDGSPPSLAALTQAIELAEDVGATLELVHVQADDEPLDEMEEALQEAHDVLGDRLKLRFVHGDPTEQILELASAGGADLIVMGTHGRVGRLHSLLGSVAEAVVRNSPCPVLTVRRSAGEDESFSERVHGRPRVAG